MSRASSGSSSKGSATSSSESITKSRHLVTKGEKLIALRNALFDDDPGGFGAERDVTRWLAAPFKKYARNGLDMSIEFAHGESLIGQDLQDLIDLAAIFAEEVEEDAGREYYPEDKEEHLTEDAARFLIVRDASGKIQAFAHFRFTLHGELADVMEGMPCLFVYDVHVSGMHQRKGLGKHLVTMLELIARKANMYEMVMPVPESPLAEPCCSFMLGLKGWAQDSLESVSPKTARALEEDGSLSVFVKVLRPRDEELTPEIDPQLPAAPELSAAAVPPMVFEGTTADADGSDEWAAGPSESANQKKGAGKKSKSAKKKAKAKAPIAGSSSVVPVAIE